MNIKFPNLGKIFASVFGAGNSELVIDEAKNTVTMSVDQFKETEKLAGEVVTLRESKETLEQEKTTAVNEKTAAVNSLNDIKAKLGLDANADATAVDARIGELKSIGGAGTSSGKKEGEQANTDAAKAELQKQIDNMPHNRVADESVVVTTQPENS